MRPKTKTLLRWNVVGCKSNRNTRQRGVKVGRTVLLGLLCCTIGNSYANRAPNDSEVRLLPPYCIAFFNLSKNPEAARPWRDAWGPDFGVASHYCVGLNLINRSYVQPRMEDKRDTLTAALNEIDYTMGHASPGFALRPEMHLNRGVALSLMKEAGRAVVEFQKAIELDPKLAKAYVLLADQYVSLKETPKALAAVTEGLRQVPENRVLQRRYDELGGKKPYPEPYAKALPTSPESPGDGGSKEKSAKDDIPAPATSAPQPAMADRNAEGAGPQPITPAEENKSGKNPWCRFCPD